ncbi:peroxiredoxin-like family protein [Nitrogeniibacter aestuarii]|uniref:peroxiredoxin-like family protein n=1 Tax=Nitrogeniibacter aestuarii TaxID=2815343 RepID=UPI001E382AE9|nr:peroxiredoxin-like family protein [Nitrogeniibacter aestuarii]
MLMPRQAVPGLNLPLHGGGHFDLAEAGEHRFTMLVFYRGLHCPICAKYLKELAGMASQFAERGVRLVAISSDNAERAAEMVERIGDTPLPVAHSLPLQLARDWGLYLSTSRGKTSIGIEEPAVFSEPGIFLVRPDGTLYFAAVQTMPFARPDFADLLGAIDFAIAKDYPARGEYTGAV